MRSDWVAASVRARSMAQRRAGAGTCRRLASAPGLQEALAGLSDSVYGEELAAAQSLAQAQRATRRTVLWQLRVLAGWVPAGGTRLIRAAAAAFEADNILALDRHLRRERTAPAAADNAGIGAGGNTGFAGGNVPVGGPVTGPAGGNVPVVGGIHHPQGTNSLDAEFDLGGLATAWPRLRTAGSVEELRAGLASSPWGEPGPETGEADILTMVWLRRLASEAAAARPWAASAGVLICARLLLVAQAPPAGQAASAGQATPAERGDEPREEPREPFQPIQSPPPPERLVALLRPLLGTGWIRSNSVESLRAAVPPAAGQALEGVDSPSGLWRAEAAFAARVETDGFSLLRAGLPGPDVVLGAMVVLAADAWRVRAALASAALNGAAGTGALPGASASDPSAATGTSEVLDAVA